MQNRTIYVKYINIMTENDIRKAYDIINDYNGENNQILYYKILNNKKQIVLKEFDVNYILTNYQYETQHINKTVNISGELTEHLIKKYELDFSPTKIKITKIIGELGGSYHCYVQYRKSVEPQLMYIKKKFILNELYDTNYEDLEINFDVFDEKTKHLDRKLKDHQKSAVKFLLTNKKCILADSQGLGKEQDVDTLTPTPNGFVRMGDLRIGDDIFGCDGNIYQVEGIFPQGEKDIYEIEFTDGSKTNCGLEHLWFVKDKTAFSRKQDWKIMSLKEILERGIEYSTKTSKIKRHKYKYRIPICQCVNFKEQKHFIDPYLLGICIGDASLGNGGIVMSIPEFENETLIKIQKLINDDYKLTSYKGGTCDRYRISQKVKKGENLYYKEIKRLGLNIHGNNKFIPNEYKFDSKENRIKLLRGLMDSDGYITKKNNKISFSNKSLKLCKDVIELVQSLGGLATLHKYIRNKNNSKTSIEYMVSIKIEICPFSLKRKCERYTITTNHRKYLVKSIKNVKFSHKSQAVCIKVNSPDHSYLTNNYIVTHNTTSAIVAAIGGGFKKILIITTASLKTTWKKEIELYEDGNEITVINGSNWDGSKKFTIANYDIIQNFYEVPMEPVFEEQIIIGKNGAIETLRVPVMVKSKSTGKMVQKMQKSRKKEKIMECLRNSPLFLNKFDCVIIDEAQKLSNNTSIRYKTIDDFLKRSQPQAVFLLSGTPLTNRPFNLYNILKLIGAEITKDYKYFITRYCDGKTFRLKDGREITTANGASNLNELREKIKHLYIRRLQSDIPGMVNKTILTREYDLTLEQQDVYNKLWQDYLDAQDEEKAVESENYRQLVEGGIVRQYLAKEMTQHTIEEVDEIIEYGEKVIVFCTYKEEMEMFKKHYGNKCVVHNGEMTTKQKDKSVNEFMNNPKVMVFIGQIISASVGLTLTVANKLIFNSYSWVAADNLQAQDRIYRLTQTRDVTCQYNLFTDSVSQDMFEKVMRKELIMNETIKSENEKNIRY